LRGIENTTSPVVSSLAVTLAESVDSTAATGVETTDEVGSCFTGEEGGEGLGVLAAAATAAAEDLVTRVLVFSVSDSFTGLLLSLFSSSLPSPNRLSSSEDSVSLDNILTVAFRVCTNDVAIVFGVVWVLL